MPEAGWNCICGGRSARFPDSGYPCRCYSNRNPACSCVVNPGGQDGVLHDHRCAVHSRSALSPESNPEAER